RPPPAPAPFPYTTLFRSRARRWRSGGPRRRPRRSLRRRGASSDWSTWLLGCVGGSGTREPGTVGRRVVTLKRPTIEGQPKVIIRSEEHTSELQSRSDLVC